MKQLEEAIPEHLRLERTQPLGAPEGFTPQHPSYSARFDESVKTLPIIYVGVQYPSGKDISEFSENIRSAFSLELGPKFWDQASYRDEAGYENLVFVGYWDSEKSAQDWQGGLNDDWWHQGADIKGEIGFFIEAYTPSIMDTETTFSHPYPEGYSKIAKHMSGETDTHEYWGAARDRIPRGQIDPLNPAGEPKPSNRETKHKHVTVQPHENLCLLRSGQDWTETDNSETDFYLEKVEPYLDEGMIEIRDQGRDFGCYFCRYMHIVENGERVKKTYSLSAWHSLAYIEKWVKADTHLAIWAAGIKHYKNAGDHAKLRLYHEMFVIKAKDQRFEYFNCHEKTGMLNAIRSGG